MKLQQKILNNSKLILLALGLVDLGLGCLLVFWISLRPQVSLVNQKYQNLLSYQHPLIPKLINPSLKPQSLISNSYIVVDNETNTVLLSQNPHLRIYPASVTKLAAAVTALNVYPLDEVITVRQPYTEGKIMELQVGEKITVKSLVTALLVYSANDSAFNLASHYPQGEDTSGFIKEMNNLSTKYQLKDTHFVNHDGIHSDNHYSSVYDLSQLGRIAVKNPIVRQYVKTKAITVTDITGTIKHPLITTNELLGVVPEIEGLKTGWTPEAGGCFVGLVNVNGHELITVVAQSGDRFADTTSLVNWIKGNVTWLVYQP